MLYFLAGLAIGFILGAIFMFYIVLSTTGPRW